jgi:hypothetical protein
MRTAVREIQAFPAQRVAICQSSRGATVFEARPAQLLDRADGELQKHAGCLEHNRLKARLIATV